MSNKAILRWSKFMRFGERLGCHQMPERSFFVKGYQFPVCARCTGVIIGEIIAIVLLILNIRISIIQSLVLLVPMGIDWGLQFIKLLASTNVRRVISGLLGGVALTYVYYYVIAKIVSLCVDIF